MSDDKPTAADRSAGTQPGCRCTAHCEHVHGDQAEDEETRELFRLRAELRAGFAREDAFRAEVARFRDRLEEYRREVERRDEYLRGADVDLKEARAEVERLKAELRDAGDRCGEWNQSSAFWRNEAEVLSSRRNAARTQVATLTAERDGAVAEAAALRRERDVARLAVDVERELCAEVALDERNPFVGTDNGARNQACEDIAAAIRERGTR